VGNGVRCGSPVRPAIPVRGCIRSPADLRSMHSISPREFDFQTRFDFPIEIFDFRAVFLKLLKECVLYAFWLKEPKKRLSQRNQVLQ